MAHVFIVLTLLFAHATALQWNISSTSVIVQPPITISLSSLLPITQAVSSADVTASFFLDAPGATFAFSATPPSISWILQNASHLVWFASWNNTVNASRLLLIQLTEDAATTLTLTLTEGLNNPVISTISFPIISPIHYQAPPNPYAYTPPAPTANTISSDALRIALGAVMIALAVVILAIYCLCRTATCMRKFWDTAHAPAVELEKLKV